MKKHCLLISCLMACVFISQSALAGNAVSRPAGVIRIELEPGSSTFLSLPFDAADNTVKGVFANQLEDVPCVVMKWDKAAQEVIEK